MRVNVHCSGNRRMSQHLTNHLGVDSEAHHQGGERVAIVVQSGFQAGFHNYFLRGMTEQESFIAKGL